MSDELKIVRDWLLKLPDLDLEDIVADGGVTSGMVVQQEAALMASKLSAILARAQGHPIANVYGGHLRCRSGEHRTGNGTGRTKDFPGEDKPALARALMQMPWASMGEMSEAVPPPFTRHIGEQLRALLALQTAA